VEFALFGESDDRPGDPYVMIPPVPIEQSLLPGPVAKDRLEDLQVWSCLQALALYGALAHPIEIEVPESDPPDRILRAAGVSYPVELTELTMQDLRASLSRVRMVGRRVSSLVNQNLEEFAHLADRAVQISNLKNPDGIPSGSDPNKIAGEIFEALKTDIGYLDVGISADQVAQHGLPETLDVTGGSYGELHGLFVHVNHAPREAAFPVPVVATSQADFHLSEAREIIIERINVKDRPTNKILVITTGLPDKAGYVCLPDRWLFQAIFEHSLELASHPLHLDAILMHQWDTHNIVEVYRRPGIVLPFSPGQARDQPTD
jgi:hypothetical protein